MNFNQKWINLLTGGRAEKQREFAEILVDAPSETLAIMKYRRLQMNEGRGQDITTEDISKVWNDDISLAEVLQELFLEPVEQGHINIIKRKIRLGHKSIEDIISKHEAEPTLRFLTIALTI